MKLSEILTEIVEFSKQQLNGSALAYLRDKRKLSDSLIKEFEFGFLPLHPKLKIEPKWLRYHQLICKDTKDRMRCPFEGRILLPIHNIYGDIISIQSRVLESCIDPTLENYNTRKYYHSSFDKSKTMFNLNRSIPYIRKSDKVLVTEGQFDTTTAWKFGFKNCVCTTGTAFNFTQVSLLARYASEILVVFDNDTAGQKALNKFKKRSFAGIKVKHLLLPSSGIKVDLDDFLHSNGKEALIKLVKKREV